MTVIHERPGTDHRAAKAPAHPSLFELDDAVRRRPERVGRGGTGTCYRVSTREGTCVLKIIEAPSPALRGRLRNEIERVLAVPHQGLARMHAVTHRDERILVLREFVEGPTLAEVLEKRGALPFSEAAPILREVAAAVGELHRKGLSHREIKPSHVVLGPRGAKLIDTGLPSFEPSYLPPEWTALRLVTTRSDLWQLGVLFVHALSGLPPARGGALPRSAPEPLRGLVGNLLCEAPIRRPHSVRPILEVLDGLRGLDDIEEEISGLVLLDDSPSAASVPPPLPTPRREAPLPEESTDELGIPVGFASVVSEWRESMTRAWTSVRQATRSALRRN